MLNEVFMQQTDLKIISMAHLAGSKGEAVLQMFCIARLRLFQTF